MALRFLQLISLTLLSSGLSAEHKPPRSQEAVRDFMVVLFRHGERAPLGTWERDPNGNYTWPLGFGELTKDGRDNMYYIGMWLRGSFGRFMTDDIRDVGARSSPVPRCFDSAALVLYGLYPASQRWAWKDNEDWQPVPITTVLADHDMYTFNCPNFVRNMMKSLQSTLGENNGSGLQLMDLLTRQIGISLSEPRKLLDALDALVVQAENNLMMPTWFQQNRNAIVQFNHAIYVALGSALSRNMGGEILRDIAAKLKDYYYPANTAAKYGDTMAPLDVPVKIKERLHLFSYHDLNLIAVLYSLNPNEIKTRPDYGSLVIFESAYHPLANEQEIRVFFRDGDTNAVLYNMTGCPYPCKLSSFLNYVEETFTPVTARECGIPEDYILL